MRIHMYSSQLSDIAVVIIHPHLLDETTETLQLIPQRHQRPVLMQAVQGLHLWTVLGQRPVGDWRVVVTVPSGWDGGHAERTARTPSGAPAHLLPGTSARLPLQDPSDPLQWRHPTAPLHPASPRVMFPAPLFLS